MPVLVFKSEIWQYIRMRIQTNANEVLRFLRTDCQIHGRGRKKWWADRLRVAPMMISHWLAGRRLPSAGHLSAIYFLVEQVKAEKQKAGYSDLLWRHYYDNQEIDPLILRSTAERLLVSKGLSSRLLALLSWLFEKYRPQPYQLIELPLHPLWQNRLGWLHESAGLVPGFEPRALRENGVLLELEPSDFGPAFEKYLAGQQTAFGKKWRLYDCSMDHLKEQLDWRRLSRPNTKESLIS